MRSVKPRGWVSEQIRVAMSYCADGVRPCEIVPWVRDAYPGLPDPAVAMRIGQILVRMHVRGKVIRRPTDPPVGVLYQQRLDTMKLEA